MQEKHDLTGLAESYKMPLTGLYVDVFNRKRHFIIVRFTHFQTLGVYLLRNVGLLMLM